MTDEAQSAFESSGAVIGGYSGLRKGLPSVMTSENMRLCRAGLKTAASLEGSMTIRTQKPKCWYYTLRVDSRLIAVCLRGSLLVCERQASGAGADLVHGVGIPGACRQSSVQWLLLHVNDRKAETCLILHQLFSGCAQVAFFLFERAPTQAAGKSVCDVLMLLPGEALWEKKMLIQKLSGGRKTQWQGRMVSAT